MNAHLLKVQSALRRAESDARLLDGRDFDARYWQQARRSLSMLARQLEVAQRERDAFVAVLTRAEGDTP